MDVDPLLLFKNFTFGNLNDLLNCDDSDIYDWLTEARLIPKSRQCKTCGSNTRIARNRGKYKFVCTVKRCGKSIQVTSDTFIERSHLSFKEVSVF
uniref:Transposase n=1 Tax=Panagrolaimus davidi TaxID=227884 RepID=A0A914PP49_9BILA